MVCRLFVVSAILLVCGIGRAAAAPSGPPYYLALGDSTAIGIQRGLPTNQGYADDLFALLRLRHPTLRLAKLGCSGETTTTMLNGGKCADYDSGNQLDDAVQFMQTHRVGLITLSIGGDNVLGCIILAGVISIDEDCVLKASLVIGPEMVQILATLRAAAGPTVPIVGMNYYDPFLAAWTLGQAGQELALRSLEITNGLNDLLGALYFAFQMPVADVAHAFRINDFTPVPVFNVPRNVLFEFAWTWIGASPPDIHPNNVGYWVIAKAFAKAMGSL